uniref:Uncharacterized protein n=1 Tax=Pithovirus LCDPAC02 TaxID=2506601 RepID=A0A481YP14_9VIRU|nr:MAG: hypothetical protein LCDPAC02_02000 [Pithovirus LCDPAC02]
MKVLLIPNFIEVDKIKEFYPKFTIFNKYYFKYYIYINGYESFINKYSNDIYIIELFHQFYYVDFINLYSDYESLIKNFNIIYNLYNKYEHKIIKNSNDLKDYGNEFLNIKNYNVLHIVGFTNLKNILDDIKFQLKGLLNNYFLICFYNFEQDMVNNISSFYNEDLSEYDFKDLKLDKNIFEF